VFLHAAPQHDAIEDVEGREQSGRAVALVVVGHGPALAGLDRQAWLGGVERLDLALLVDRQHHGVGGRVHVEADDVLDLLGEGWILGAFDRAQPVGLEVVRLPDALNGPERQTRRLGHGPSGPVGELAGRLEAGQRHDLGHHGQGRARLAGLAAAFAQQPLDPALAIMVLPASHRRAADAGAARNFRSRRLIRREKDNLGALNVLERPAAVTDDRGQARAVFGGNDHGYGLSHARKIAQMRRSANPMIVSVH